MPNKMLIDATHPEETRVVVLRGNRVEEFDFESASRKQLRGNIYLAKVTRVEPSLQAAFVDYGGNRHGFLAFSEIHPDYYQIPVADRQALIDEEEREARAADVEADNRAARRSRHERHAHRRRDEIKSEPVAPQETDESAEGEATAMAAASEMLTPEASESMDPSIETSTENWHEDAAPAEPETAEVSEEEMAHDQHADESNLPIDLAQLESSSATEHVPAGDDMSAPNGEPQATEAAPAEAAPASGENVTEINGNGAEGEEEAVESVGGADVMEEVPERAPRLRRQYKIQEVIKRRQVMLVQVVKEERGTKGAALTTYLSLAGRYSVLMPNTARGGGISRKITDAQDRRRLKELVQELEVPEGMGVILRTAGASRTKTEIKRDFEYLLRLWETVRDLTLRSTAPTLVYEEGSLVKRSIRDLYNKDIDEILVAGDQGYTEARDFMRMLMPSHSRNVKPYRDTLPVFTRFGIESQLDAMFQPVVQLRSGGYVVLNQTEALVAIDVNSGRATREHHIEDTALKTNLEAAEEIARQLRLRDLAGLIVIDFIDMDEKRNNRTVERRLKDALKHDRARIQVGHISHFGLLEMSRQRIRSSVLESSTEKCPHCGGSGHVRSVASVSLQLLRALDETLLKSATHNLGVRTRTEIALYLLNHKRAHLRALEERFQLTITINADATIGGQQAYVIEKGEQVHSPEQAKAIAAAQPATLIPLAEEEEVFEEAEAAPGEEELAEEGEGTELEGAGAEGFGGEAAEGTEGVREGGRPRRRRRRGRRGEAREGGAMPHAEAQAAPAEEESAEAEAEAEGAEAGGGRIETAGEPRENGRRRRRGRRGGRRSRRGREGESLQNGSHEPAGEPDSFASADESSAGAAEWSDSAPEAPADELTAARHEPEPSPYPQEQRAEPAAAPTSEPRRRSTVREAAPVSFQSSAEPVAPPAEQPPAQPVPVQPAVVSGSTEDESKPRRSGWWSRRG